MKIEDLVGKMIIKAEFVTSQNLVLTFSDSTEIQVSYCSVDGVQLSAPIDLGYDDEYEDDLYEDSFDA